MTIASFTLALVLASQTPSSADAASARASAARPADASAERSSSTRLTPEEAVRLALERSGTVKAAYLDAEIARAEDGLSLDPIRLRLGHNAADGPLSSAYTDNNGIPYGPLDEAYVALGWSFPKPSDLVDAAVAEEAFQADRSDAVTIERDFAASVLLLYSQTVSLRAEADLARSSVEIARQLEAKTDEQLAAELSTSLESRLASLERLDAAADAEQVSGEALKAEYDLAGLVGLPVPLQLAPSAKPLCAAPKRSVNELIERAAARSEKLAEHKARKDRASFQSALSWTRLLPYLDAFQVGWHNEPLDKRDSMRARIDIALPIFEPFASSSHVANLELQRADAMYAEELRQIDAKTRSAVTRLEGALALVSVHEESDKSIVDESLADVARALEAGAVDVLQLAEVQRRAVRARRNLIRARYRCDEAAIELARVTGDVVAERAP